MKKKTDNFSLKFSKGSVAQKNSDTFGCLVDENYECD